MKAIATLFTTSLFVAGAYAGSGTLDIYGDFAKGNSDLAAWQSSSSEEMTGVQPGIGDAPYGLGSSRDDALFKSAPGEGPVANRIDIYGEFVGPDLPSSY
jgi:hypothetical protein